MTSDLQLTSVKTFIIHNDETADHSKNTKYYQVHDFNIDMNKNLKFQFDINQTT